MILGIVSILISVIGIGVLANGIVSFNFGKVITGLVVSLIGVGFLLGLIVTRIT